MPGVVSQRQQRRVIDDDRSGEKPRASPGERGEGAPKAGRETHRGTAGYRHLVDLSADRAEVAHEATDESYGAAVGRDARDRHLQLEAGYSAAAAADVERIELRDPPVRIAIALRCCADEATTVRHPVVFVNVGIRRRYEVQLAAALRHDRDPLLVELDADLTARGRPGLERAGALLRRHRREDRELTPVGREARRLGNALDPSEDGQLRATRESELCLTLDRVAADERELSSVRRPGEARVTAERAGIQTLEHVSIRSRAHDDRSVQRCG